MNKTAILSFILDEVALKCRNVSTNMRKRIQWMLKYREITLKKYDERALILNGLVRVGRNWIHISKLEEMKKGLTNYYLKTQKQLDRLMILNNEVRCSSLNFSLTYPIRIESIEMLMIDQYSFDVYSKCSFSRIKRLATHHLSTDQMKVVLKRIRRIDRLVIRDSVFNTIDFSEFKIKSLTFDCISFTEPFNLPREIEELELLSCVSPNLLKIQKVNKINFDSRFTEAKEDKELVKTLKGVKFADIRHSLVEYLPSTVREINIKVSRDEVDNFEEIIKLFPYLIKTDISFPIEILERSKMRVIDPIMNNSEDKFSLRPRKIAVTSKNIDQLNNHPELFEKVEFADINVSKFNFDVLPSEIKRIKIWQEVNEESSTLNRLEKERR